MGPDLRADDLPAIQELLQTKEGRKSGLIKLQHYLEYFPGNVDAWRLMAQMFSLQNHHALTKLALEKALTLETEDVALWWELSKSCNNLLLEDEAEVAAREIMRIDPSDYRGPLQMAVCKERRAEYDDSIIWCERALELNPEARHAKATMGFCYLHKRDYEKGWALYHYGLGHISSRDKHTYVGEPEWDGSPNRHVAVYSEQGIGDQIAGIEPLRDFPGTVVALSVDRKLNPWFARCFPEIAYHGPDIAQQAQFERDPLRVDVSINLFGLHKHLRKSEAAYPKTPFLTPHPRKAAMWRTALDQLGPSPKIGIAWSGGVHITHQVERTHDLEAWLAAIGSFPCNLISLEYRDRDEETAGAAKAAGKEIHVWPDAIRSSDYEDTAALISQLDAVVAPPTTVVHAAGAMGIPAFCLVHKHANPHYGVTGDRMPYYGSVMLVRSTIEDLCQHLFKFLSATTS